MVIMNYYCICGDEWALLRLYLTKTRYRPPVYDTYDTKGRVTTTNEYIDNKESNSIKTTNTYSNSTAFSAKPKEVKIDGWRQYKICL